MLRQSLPLMVLAVALAGCGGSGSGSTGNGTSSSASSSSTTASSGSSSGTTSGGLPPFGDGGCSNEVRGTELLACNANSGCACPQTCRLDTGVGQTVCELPCTSVADCPSVATTCTGGFCAFNFCVLTLLDAGVPGHFGETCGASGPTAMDGTCIPSFDHRTYASLGYCVPNGTATSTCNPDTPDNPEGPAQGLSMPGTPRYPASDYCGAGYACGPTGSCEAFCNPTQSSCGGRTVCVAQDLLDTTWGLCSACVTAGQACILSTDCCSQSCDPVNGCAGGCDPTEGC